MPEPPIPGKKRPNTRSVLDVRAACAASLELLAAAVAPELAAELYTAAQKRSARAVARLAELERKRAGAPSEAQLEGARALVWIEALRAALERLERQAVRRAGYRSSSAPASDTGRRSTVARATTSQNGARSPRK